MTITSKVELLGNNNANEEQVTSKHLTYLLIKHFKKQQWYWNTEQQSTNQHLFQWLESMRVVLLLSLKHTSDQCARDRTIGNALSLKTLNLSESWCQIPSGNLTWQKKAHHVHRKTRGNNPFMVNFNCHVTKGYHQHQHRGTFQKKCLLWIPTLISCWVSPHVPFKAYHSIWALGIPNCLSVAPQWVKTTMSPKCHNPPSSTRLWCSHVFLKWYMYQNIW